MDLAKTGGKGAHKTGDKLAKGQHSAGTKLAQDTPPGAHDKLSQATPPGAHDKLAQATPLGAHDKGGNVAKGHQGAQGNGAQLAKGAPPGVQGADAQLAKTHSGTHGVHAKGAPPGAMTRFRVLKQLTNLVEWATLSWALEEPRDPLGLKVVL